MTPREAFNRILNYERADRVPLMVIDPYESLTVDLWRQQGLPPDVAPAEFLKMDTAPAFQVSLKPIPQFAARIISENATEYLELDGMGCTVRRLKEAPAMYYGVVDHPVKNSDDWKRYKERLVANTPGRYWPDLDQIVEIVNSARVPVGLSLYPWFFRYGFYLMGMERFLMAFYDLPELIHDIFAHIGGLALALLRPLLARAKFDYACYSEDLAFHSGPHISPEIYREFWLPHQDPVTAEFRRAGIPIVGLYSSGNCKALLPLAMEHGINATWPCERNSDMDPLALRKQFGKDLRLVGGIGHTCLSGGRAAIDEEVRRLMPLVREGGFIPMIDDMVPPEVPFENYRYCIESLRSIAP